MARKSEAAPEVISFISSKGGSGKTITSYCIAQFLVELKYRVLLIDADASTNGLTLLTLPFVTSKKRSAQTEDLFGLFDSDGRDKFTAIKINNGLTLLPSTFRMIDTEAVSVDDFEERLREVISSTPEVDFILIDAQAGIDHFAKVAVKMADQSVIVSEYDPSSVEGIERLKLIFSDVLKIERSWVLFNKILPEFGRAIGDGLIIARYLPPIIWNADVVRAVATRDSPLNFKNPTNYTLAIAELMYRLFSANVRDRISAWLKHAREKSTTPLKSRLDRINIDLDNAFREEVRLTHLMASGRNFARLMILGLALVTGSAILLEGLKLARSGIEHFAGYWTVFVAFVVAWLGGSSGIFWLDSRRTREQSVQLEGVSRRRRDLEREREKLLAAVDSADMTMKISENYRSFG